MRLRSVIEVGLDSKSQGASREALVRALEETERVASMLTTLMDISEAETGTMKLVRQRVVLADVVREACDLYADLAEDKQIVLEPHVPAGLSLPADRGRLRQVLANLIDNALKYTPPGGRVDITGLAEADRVVISVADTGVGIPEPDLPRIWERLFRGDSSRSERGLGLGLSLVKAIVEAHGGHVAVKSTIGQGSEFLLMFPASSATDVSATAA
jgi:signal transduction histidine kinase